MVRLHARRPTGSAANTLQPMPTVTHFNDEVLADPNSSLFQDIQNTTVQPDTPHDSPIQPTSKRTRGSARPYIDWGTEKKLKVELNSHNQPIGKTASKLASQLGIIARSGIFCPIIYKDWRCKELVPLKQRIWEEVKNNCHVSDSYKETCLRSVGNKWRNWRDLLRDKHYYIYDNDEERLANVPEGVDPDQWKIFVAYTGSETFKKRSKTNRENQKKKVMSHTTGRKSHAVVRTEMMVNGIEPDRIEVYFKTHTKSDGSPVDEEAAKVIAAMKEKLLAVPKSQQTAEFREKVFTDVLGFDGHGRVRTLGFGPCPTKVFGKKNNPSHDSQSHGFENVREEVREEVREVVREELREEMREVVKQEVREEVREVVREEVREEMREIVGKEVREEMKKEYGDRFERLERQYAGLQNQMRDKGKNVVKSRVGPSVAAQEVSDTQSSHYHYQPRRHHEDPTNPPFKVGMVVNLLNINVPKKVVAVGTIISKDPNKDINGMRVGDGFWIVCIDKVILPHDPLLIPCGDIRKLGQAVKKNVFWRVCDIKKIK